MTPTPTRPEPTTPTREALQRWCDELIAAQEAFDEIYARQAANNGDADILREFDDKAEALDALKEDEVLIGVASWIKQHLTSEPAALGCKICGATVLNYDNAKELLKDGVHSMAGRPFGKKDEPEPAASVPVTRDVLVKHFKSRIQPPFAAPETLAQEGFLERFEARSQKKAEDDADAILALLAASTGARGAVVEEIAKRHEADEAAIQKQAYYEPQQSHYDRAKLLALIGAKGP